MSFLVSIFKPLAYISLPIFLIHSIANSSSALRYYARVGLYVGTLMAVGSCSFFAAAGMSFLGRSTDVNYLVAQIFYALAGRALELEVVVEGEEHLKSQPALLMTNHQSMLDVLIVGRLMPKQTVIMAKKSLQFSPLGPFMTMAGTIFISRGNSASAIRSIEEAGERMKRTRTSLWIYPEGTRHMSKTPDMLPLKKGGFHLAINAGIPIIPIVTENYWHMYRKGVFGSGVIKVRVLPPIPTNGLTPTDIGAFSNLVRDQMLEALRDISQKEPSLAISEGEKQKEEVEQQQTPSQDADSVALKSAAIVPSPSAPNSVDEVLDASVASSSASLSSSLSSSSRLRAYGSENGGETEEDEGMILVGRPSNK